MRYVCLYLPHAVFSFMACKFLFMHISYLIVYREFKDTLTCFMSFSFAFFFLEVLCIFFIILKMFMLNVSFISLIDGE